MPTVDIDLPDDSSKRLTPSDILARLTLDNPTLKLHDSGGFTHQAATNAVRKFHNDPAWNPAHYTDSIRKQATQEVDAKGNPVGSPVLLKLKSGAQAFTVRFSLTDARIAELKALAAAQEATNAPTEGDAAPAAS